MCSGADILRSHPMRECFDGTSMTWLKEELVGSLPESFS